MEIPQLAATLRATLQRYAGYGWPTTPGRTTRHAFLTVFWMVAAAIGPPVGASPGGALAAPAVQRDGARADPTGAGLQQLLLDPAAALREANASLARGDHRRAGWMLREVAERHPIVADHADLLRARMRMEKGAAEVAAEIALHALQLYVDSPLRADFYRLLGDARASLSDVEAARAAWSAALDETRDAERRAALRAALGASLERSGKLQEAGSAYLELWVEHPLKEEGSQAGKRLNKLERELQKPLRDGAAWLRRGEVLYRKRSHELALRAFGQALGGELDEAQRERASLQRARTLFRMRRYSDAVKAFSALPQDDDIAVWRARSIARAGDVPTAIRELETLATLARGTVAGRARFLAALLLEDRDERARARKHMQKLSTGRWGRGLADSALWQLGWVAYTEGRYSDALPAFEKLLQHEKDPIAKLRLRYWRARSLQRLNSPKGLEALAAIAREYPLSYYGWRALSRAPRNGKPAATTRIARGRSRLSPRDLARPRILLGAGMVLEANEELRRVSARARSLQDRLELAQLFTDAEDFHRAQLLIVEAYTEPLARGPVPNLEELWWYAWPAAYADLVGPATASRNDVDSDLVYSIMREESGYRPSVVSVSGARGLLQIMSETGARLARDVGHRSFSVDDLFEPKTNIGLGSHYLGQLSRRFDGHLSAAVAGYNAGPQTVSAWLRRRTSPEDDEWVESIPYDQTRSYVKRVLRSLHAYRVLY